jgi:hypothetical protein
MILTAAHCLHGNASNARHWYAFSLRPDGSDLSLIANAVIHPKYGEDQYNFDSAIFYLKYPLTHPPAKLDFMGAVPGDIVVATGIGNTQIDGYDFGNHKFVTSNLSPFEVNRVTTKISKECHHQGYCMDANNEKSILPGDSGGGIYKNGKLVGNVVGFDQNFETGNIVNDNGARLDENVIRNAMGAKMRENNI